MDEVQAEPGELGRFLVGEEDVEEAVEEKLVAVLANGPAERLAHKRLSGR